ncbi:hypothetical protein, conserved [Entamoeba dispar SAW760]|uniref:Uncharacterized protein n=1 Tax=Entamoeba dispar (strain ATCC PRA-260 / SAW760) TaxID=370354 RepID=B0ETZ7_ENTDS|nr:uncharacterized protein EDI_214510 [Entamoeba dispar SAW760]EDR21998.1 hypothetical protein, conserved [Entamoeba dispar SAW760]|eukprot:EDR21998.1 hypothetical protein, conserved [Entamoeba dispar SAW760]
MSKRTSKPHKSSKKVTKKTTYPHYENKKFNEDSVIGVSGFGFEFDVVLSIVLLRSVNQFKRSSIKFLHSKEEMKGCDVVLGYGGQYDPSLNLFDYHQKGFNNKYPGSTYLMTCSSMVFLKFGKEIVNSYCFKYIDPKGKSIKVTDEIIRLVCKFYYLNRLESIDAILNGVLCYNDPIKYESLTDGIYVTSDYCTTIDDIELIVANEYKNFHSTMNLTIETATLYHPVIRKAKESLQQQGLYKRILFCDQSVNNSLVIEVEKELKCEGNFLFFIRQSPKGCYIFSINETQFVNRKSLPKSWRGKENEELEEACGEKGAFFCHHSGFMLSCSNLNVAKKLAIKAMTEE